MRQSVLTHSHVLHRQGRSSQLGFGLMSTTNKHSSMDQPAPATSAVQTPAIGSISFPASQTPLAMGKAFSPTAAASATCCQQRHPAASITRRRPVAPRKAAPCARRCWPGHGSSTRRPQSPAHDKGVDEMLLVTVRERTVSPGAWWACGVLVTVRERTPRSRPGPGGHVGL